jgi:CTP synthase (UTP-ammonia lyase)
MKNILTAVLMMLFPLFLKAQSNSGRSQEVESFRVAYLTQKMGLTADEAKIFWPIYNDWQKEQNALRKVRMQHVISLRKIDEIENLTDTEVQSLITNELDFKQRSLNVEKKYYTKLRTSLPIKVVGKYYRAQESFKKELLTRYGRGKRN